MSATVSSFASVVHPGVYRVSVTGIGLSESAQAALAVDLQAQQDLIDGMVRALHAARAAGEAGFLPSLSRIALPDGMSEAELNALFTSVVGRPFFGPEGVTPGFGQLSLSQWSDAVLLLQRDAAAKASRLGPGSGGGIQYADGAWFINGQRYTLTESFLALRVANFTNMDAQLAEHMNKSNINAITARKLLGLVADLNRTFGANGGKDGSYTVTDDLLPVLEDNGLTLADLASWGGSVAASSYFASVLASYTSNANAAISGEDFGSLITETKSIFDATNADNQVSQLRMESLVNARENLLRGLTNYLKGDQVQMTAMARGLQAGQH